MVQKLYTSLYRCHIPIANPSSINKLPNQISMGNSEYELNGHHKKLKNIEEGEEDQNENETSK